MLPRPVVASYVDDIAVRRYPWLILSSWIIMWPGMPSSRHSLSPVGSLGGSQTWSGLAHESPAVIPRRQLAMNLMAAAHQQS